MEKLLKKEAKFKWNEDHQKVLDVLKQNLVTAPILVLLYWKEFHICVDASSITLSAVPTELGEGELDHMIVFSIRKFSIVEKNYMTTEREALEMVYTLHKSRHFLLVSHFKMYTNHSALRYLVNKLVLGGGEDLQMVVIVPRV
jgi:hypothetical protein